MSTAFKEQDYVIYNKYGFWKITKLSSANPNTWRATATVVQVVKPDGTLPDKVVERQVYLYKLSVISEEDALKFKEIDERKWKTLLGIINPEKYIPEKNIEEPLVESSTLLDYFGPPEFVKEKK